MVSFVCLTQTEAPSNLPIFLSLSYLDQSSEEFVSVEMHRVFIKAGISGACFTVLEHASSAQVWRLCWAQQDHSSDSYDLLSRLYINPQGEKFFEAVKEAMVEAGETLVSTPLSTSSTIAFSFRHCAVSILAPHSSAQGTLPGAHMLNSLAVLRADNFVVAVHRWDAGAQAVDAAMTARLEYTESSTLCATTLLEPFEIRASLDIGQAGVVQFQETDSGNNSGIALLLDTAGGFALQDGSIWKFGVRCYPKASGSELTIDLPSPFIINIGELAMHDLQRLLYLMSNTNCTELPIRLVNLTATDLFICQQGTKSRTMLACGSSEEFYWTSPPRLRQGSHLRLQ